MTGITGWTTVLAARRIPRGRSSLVWWMQRHGHGEPRPASRSTVDLENAAEFDDAFANTLQAEVARGNPPVILLQPAPIVLHDQIHVVVTEPKLDVDARRRA